MFTLQLAAPAAKRAARPVATCTHDVAIPEGYDVDAAGLDPAIHGNISFPFLRKAACQAACCSCPSTGGRGDAYSYKMQSRFQHVPDPYWCWPLPVVALSCSGASWMKKKCRSTQWWFSASLLCGAGTIEHPKWEGELAKKYPFILDPFQQVAVACLVSCVGTSAWVPSFFASFLSHMTGYTKWQRRTW